MFSCRKLAIFAASRKALSHPARAGCGRVDDDAKEPNSPGISAVAARETAGFDGRIGCDSQEIPKKPAENWGSGH